MAPAEKKDMKKRKGPGRSARSSKYASEEREKVIPTSYPDPNGLTAESLLHELRLHQTDLKAQFEELKRDYLALEASREKYLDFYEFAPLGYLTLSEQAIVTDLNLTCAKLLGVERSTLSNAHFREFIAPNYLEQWDQYFYNVLKTREKETCNLTLIRGDGSMFSAQIESIRLSCDSRGPILRVALSETTERRTTEEKLKKEQDFTRLLLNTSAAFFVVIGADGRTITMNQALLDVLEYTGEEVKGADYLTTFVPEEDRFILSGIFREIIDKDQATVNENRIISKSGKIYLVEWHGRSLKHVDKDLDFFVGVGIDITERKRVEDALHESEERYRTIVEDQTEFICRFIPDGTHTFVNEAYCRTFGLDREKVIGTRFKPKIHPEDRDIVTGLINSLTPNHQVETIDQRTIMPDNSIRWQRWVDRAIFRADGTLKEYQSVGRDITELIDRDLALNQKNIELQASYEQISAAEEELRHQVEEIMVEQQARHESEEKFRLVVESAPDAIFVQTDGLFAYCNPAAIRLFDATSTEQLEGRRVLDQVHPDFQETFREKFRHLEEEQEPIKNFEQILLRMDGSSVDVELSAVLVTYRQKSGTLVFVRDITEQKRITEELHETEGRLGDIINFLPDATFAIDSEGTVIAWNRAIEEMTGISAKDILGKRNYEYSIPFYGDRRPILIDLVMSQDQGLLNNYTSIERDGDAYIAETDRAHVSGKELYLWGKSVLFKNAKGDVVGAIECIRDITDHKKAEKTLRESEERYRSLYVDSRDSIMIVSPEFGFLAANPATIELFACLDEQDFMNRTPATLSPKYQPDSLKSTDKSQEMMRLALENGSHFFEWTHCRADKTIFQATVLLSRLESGGKQILQGTVRDITERKLAEEALRETEGRLGDIINFLPDATFAIDREGKVIAWNRAIEEMTGVSAKDILGKGDYEYAIPFYGERRPILIDLVMSQDPEVLNKYTSVRRDGDALTAETDRAHVGGKELYLWGKSVLFKNVKGDVVGAIESIRDITDHKKAEQELRQTLYQLTCNERNLRENEEKYRTVFENTGNATVVLDKSGCIDLANVEFTHLSGFSKDDIEGKMRLPDFVISEDRERMLAHHHLHWQEQKASLTHYEFRFVTRSGDIRNIYLSIDLIPGTNKSVASLLDITGRKQAEELYQTVFENTGTAMVIIEEDMTISHVNQEMEKIWGYLKEEIEGRVKWPTLVAEEDRKSMIDYHQLWLVSNDSSPVSYEFRFIHKNGTLRDAVLTASIIPGMKKSVISLRDITEFKKLDFHVKARTQQVEQLLRQKDEFISQVGHDLKTPLTPIIALLPHIYKEEQDPALRELLMVVIDGASAIKGLITDILTLAQLNMPYTTQDLKEMVLAEEVDKEIIKHTWEAEKRGALIKNSVSPDTRIWISPFHLESILTNLISNAVRYTPGAGCVKISSESDEESIVISVTDTGIGLAPEETPRIFEEFYKADSSRHDRNSSGLGLSIVSRIVHLYGGTVKAESLGIGYGSTFTVTIPQHN